MLIKKIYNYLVLFATLLMTIGGSVSTIMSLADIVSPPPNYQNFEQFKEMKRMKPVEKGGAVVTPEPSEQELKVIYNNMIDEEKISIRQRAINSLIKSLAWVVTPFPIFVYFQRKVRRSDKE